MVSREEYNKFVDQLLSSGEEGTHLKQFGETYTKGRVIVYVLLALFLSSSIFCFLSNLEFIACIFLLGAVGAFFTFIILRKNKNEAFIYLRKKLRYDILSFLLKGNKFSFDSRGILNENVFRTSQFVNGYSEYESSDKLVVNVPNDDGSKSKVDLTLCDLVVKQRTGDSNGSIRDVIVYRGVFGYVYFTHPIKGCLCLNSNYNGNGFDLSEVKVKGNGFKILSTDKDIVKNVLTPSMVTVINELNSKFEGVKMTFVDNKFFIGLGGNLLELGDKTDSKEDLNDLYDEIELVMKIVEEIKNNNDVFITEE